MKAAVARVSALIAFSTASCVAFCISSSWSAADPRQLQIAKVVLDQGANLFVPNASSKAHLYLLLSERVEVGE